MLQSEEVPYLELKAFRAVDEPALSQEYAAEHRRTMRRYLDDELDTIQLDWVFDPNVYVVTARWRPSGHLAGGGRLHLARRDQLPMTRALTQEQVQSWVRGKLESGLMAEVGGVFIAPGAKQLGLATLMVRGPVALAGQLGITHVCGIANQYSLGAAQGGGLIVQRELGDQGCFIYPREGWLTYVCCMDPIVLEGLSREGRDMIEAMRCTPGYQAELHSAHGVVQVVADLVLPRASLLPTASRGDVAQVAANEPGEVNVSIRTPRKEM
jgi:hypothetical protein